MKPITKLKDMVIGKGYFLCRVSYYTHWIETYVGVLIKIEDNACHLKCDYYYFCNHRKNPIIMRKLNTCNHVVDHVVGGVSHWFELTEEEIMEHIILEQI